VAVFRGRGQLARPGRPEPETPGRPPRGRPFAPRSRLLVLAILAGLTIGVVVAALRTEPFGFALKEGEPERLMDFAAHRAFACAAWSGDAARDQTSIYALGMHLRATERWVGAPARIALPFGYSPTMLLILGPFCLLPARAAFAGWSIVGFLATAFVAARARLSARALLALITPLTIYTLALGQTAILSTAGLLFLMARDQERDLSAAHSSSGTMSSAVVLWLLAAKPPLALTAGVALLARGRWRTVAVAMLLTAVSILALQPWLGPSWLPDYAGLLAGYDRAHLPEAFAWSITPELMSNLRAALHVDLGMRDDVAIRVSAVIWSISMAAIILAAWKSWLDSSLVWGFATLTFLLFCPHLSASEDLALCCVLASMDVRRSSRTVLIGSVTLVLVGLFLSPAIGPLQGTRPSALFFAKLALVAVLMGSRGLFVGVGDDSRRSASRSRTDQYAASRLNWSGSESPGT
jgi:hypothetical protein